MPEQSFLSLYSFTPEPPKKSPVIKLSCGIGDTDGFPAFDVDSEQYASKDDSKWGFLITGGAEFHMPLTVFQVTPDGLADKGGICLGDIILEINEEDATQLTLTQAHEKIDASGKKIQFLVKSMDEEELMEGYESGEERSIVLRVPKPPPPPKVAAIEKRLQELQRKLSEIAEIPKILQSTLATVSQTFDKLTTTLPLPLPPPQPQPLPPPAIAPVLCCHHLRSDNDYCPHFCDSEQKRKLSYDEDVYDYELSDDDRGGDGDGDGDGGDMTVDNREFDAKQAFLHLKRYAASRKMKSKDVTPESDYVSESNYPPEEAKGSGQTDEDNDLADDSEKVAVSSLISNEEADETENSCDMYEEFNVCVVKTPFSPDSIESDIEEYDDDDDDVYERNSDADADDDDDEDFLTTTFTWNLRNKLKQQIPVCNIENNNDEVQSLPQRDNAPVDTEGDDKFNIVDEKSCKDSTAIVCENLNLKLKEDAPEREPKMDKLERCWPWADREKIIYKQSTCHLVPQKPLGLIEKRIQLLAKRNLLEHINKIRNPQ